MPRTARGRNRTDHDEPVGPAWRQTIFYPFALAAAHAPDGVVLRVEPASPTIGTARYGDVSTLEATAVWHEDRGELVILATNRNRDEPLDLEVALRDLRDLAVIAHTTLAGPDPTLTNTKEQPDRVQPQPLDGAPPRGDEVASQALTDVVERRPPRAGAVDAARSSALRRLRGQGLPGLPVVAGRPEDLGRAGLPARAGLGGQAVHEHVPDAAAAV